MKVTISGYIVAQQYSWEKSPSFTFYGFKPDGINETIAVQPHSFEVDIPDSFDIRPGLVQNLEAEKQKLRAEFAKSVTDIDRRISELTAIGCEVAS